MVANMRTHWRPTAVFMVRALLGTRPRLALDLIRFTTGRREDAVRLGPQHIRDGRVKFVQAKNEHRYRVEIDIPLHPELAESIAARFPDKVPKEGTDHGMISLTFLRTEYGKPYTAAGFGNAMRDWCDAAGLPHCSAHGIRKSTLTQMAGKGATSHELKAVGGHRSLKQVEVYTEEADKKELADAAFAKWQGAKNRT